MRTMLIAAALAPMLALAGGAALAAPASVQVSLGPELQTKAEKTYGLRDVQDLAADLQRRVEQAAGPAYDGARIELTLADAVPNRPTFKQMGDKPGLSMRSFGLGGARIEGRIVRADGQVQPVSYRWYETDIRQARYGATWTDAQHAIDLFAHQVEHGERLAQR